MTDQPAQPFALEQVARPLSLLPVGLKEAALDSPTFRATAVHFSDQVEIVERWLEGYVRSTSRLIHDASALEDTINSFLTKSVPPSNVSEAVLDHDYTLLAMQRFGEGSREAWMRFLTGTRKMETTIVEPLKAFLNGELRNFKDARRYLEQSQKTFDAQLSRYLGQSKGKEASALREDAFQVHEARKAYLKASLDFCLLVPQLRFTIDKLLVKVSTDQWKEMKKSSQQSVESVHKWSSEMDRIKGWSKEMDVGEGVFRRELQLARKEIGKSASNAAAPSRELEDYNISTVPFLGPKGPSINDKTSVNAEKQSWLYLRSISGKPARATWVRRWFYVKSGIFGWLVQGQQSGGVEESEKIGVLLCNVKPAPGEDRRFCFEVKTKNATLMLQAETQAQLMEWLEAFEIAKNNAIKASADTLNGDTDIDPAFAITPPSVPEFAAKPEGGHAAAGSEDFAPATVFDRTNTLPVPGFDATRSSVDVTSGPGRRSITREEGESGRDHAARIIQKLDLHRRSTTAVQDFPAVPQSPTVASSAMGGIASLIASSHTILPTYAVPAAGTLKKLPPASEWNTNSLAPSTLANPPAPTNLSKAAVIISAERGIGVGRSDATGGMPSGIMANLWGSTNWGYINRLGSPDEQLGNKNTLVAALVPPALVSRDSGDGLNASIDSRLASTNNSSLNTSADVSAHPSVPSAPITPSHKKVMSMSGINEVAAPPKPEFPANYPTELKIQEAQFRMLFTNVPKNEHVVLVFRATWNPNDQQEFPGRVYVTQRNLYFYSHHLGLVLITSASLDTIDEVTAAPGKDCDFLFLHLKESAVKTDYTRITIKTFLEPLKLLQARLNYLVINRQHRSTARLEQVMTDLIKLETDVAAPDSSNESWEEVGYHGSDSQGFARSRIRKQQRDLKRAIHVEGGLQTAPRASTKFQLPSQPILYVPEGMDRKPVERVFEISPKSLFHVMFGDKSAVFQLLYHERRAQRIAQGPWVHLEHGHFQRDFSFQIDYVDMFRRQRQANVVDYQIIDVLNDHVCYVVTDKKTPWHLPHHENFMLVTKIVITHVAKSRCKLSIYNKVEWSSKPRFSKFSKGLVEKHALDDLDLDAMDLTDVVADQVRKLGPGARTKKAVQIFGHVGQQTSVSLFSSNEGDKKKGKIQQRTLGRMLWERTSSFLETAVSSVMMWIFAALKWCWKIASANSILLSLLILSAAVNMFMSGKDASEWWKEREAAAFMERVGIKPNMVMSRAVFVADLPSAVAYTSPLETLSGGLGNANEQNKCLQTFQAISNTTDLSAPYELAGVGLADKNTRATARRIRRSRQQLGSYRHDLLVAMRVVNKIEGEMVTAEWENWLVGEVSRCAGLKEAFAGEKGQKILAASTGREKEVLEWQREYCGSCRAELDRVGGSEKVGGGMF